MGFTHLLIHLFVHSFNAQCNIASFESGHHRMSHSFVWLTLMPSLMGLTQRRSPRRRRRRQAIYFLLKYDFSLDSFGPSCIFSGWLHPSQRIVDVELNGMDDDDDNDTKARAKCIYIHYTRQATVASYTKTTKLSVCVFLILLIICSSPVFTRTHVCSKFAKFKYNILTHFSLRREKSALFLSMESQIILVVQRLNGYVHCLAKRWFPFQLNTYVFINTYFVFMMCTIWNGMA